jgi:hypothetical protein
MLFAASQVGTGKTGLFIELQKSGLRWVFFFFFFFGGGGIEVLKYRLHAS